MKVLGELFYQYQKSQVNIFEIILNIGPSTSLYFLDNEENYQEAVEKTRTLHKDSSLESQVDTLIKTLKSV